MKKVKIYKLSIGGYFVENELELCKAFCSENNCTYEIDYIHICL